MKNKEEAKAYANELIEALIGFQETTEDEGLIPPVFDLWMVILREKCRIRLKEYMNGESEDFRLTDVEVREAYDKATGDWIGEGIADMVSMGVVQVSIDEKGEMVYSLTEKGQSMADEFENED